MKKSILLLLTVSMLFCFVSCKESEGGIGAGEGSQADEYVDNYIYTMIGSVLYRISPYSATAVPMCPDPLCFHDNASCPFYGVYNEKVETAGKYMYYLKDDGGWGAYAKKLCRFDMERGEFKVLYEPEEGSLLNWELNGSEIYFNLAYTDKDLKNTFDVCRFDLSTQKLTVLTEEPVKLSQNFMSEKDGRLYWRVLTGNEYYSTDREYKNRIDGDRTDRMEKVLGDYYYKIENIGFYKDTYANCFKFTAVNSVTGETIVISEELASVPVVHGGKLVYAKHGESKYLGLYLYDDSDEPKKLYDHSGGKYYICDPDGSNERLLFELEGSEFQVMWHSTMLVRDGVGDWIAIESYRYTAPDENGIIERKSNAYLLINIVSGEVKAVEIEKRN